MVNRLARELHTHNLNGVGHINIDRTVENVVYRSDGKTAAQRV